MKMRGKYPNTFYRVSLKAIIRNEKGEVLMAREHGGDWSLPGGGIDHGETDMQALGRELFEEVGYTGEFEARPVSTVSFFVETKDAWLLWVVYDVVPATWEFTCGDEADEIAFIDPCVFKGADTHSKQLVYKMCVDPDAPLSDFSSGDAHRLAPA